jgi:hypothetical protein
VSAPKEIEVSLSRNKLVKRRWKMELTEAMVNETNDEIIEVTLSGDEDEWQEVAAVLKDSDSDLATELGIRILDAINTASE